MNRAEREASEKATAIFGGAGIETRIERGGKHLVVCGSLPNGKDFRMPISGTPGHGQGGGVWLAERMARIILRGRGR